MTAMAKAFAASGAVSATRAAEASRAVERRAALRALVGRVQKALKTAQRSGRRADWERYSRLRGRLPRELRRLH